VYAKVDGATPSVGLNLNLVANYILPENGVRLPEFRPM